MTAPELTGIPAELDAAAAELEREGLACTCGECDGHADRHWDCDGCGRCVPWCNGAADDAPGLCDQCYFARPDETKHDKRRCWECRAEIAGGRFALLAQAIFCEPCWRTLGLSKAARRAAKGAR